MNIIVSWAGLVDSAGKKVGDYALHWGRGSTSPFNAWNLAWQLGTELCYVFYLFFATLSVKIMEFVSDPKWLDGLVKGYQNITERMFSVVNPILLAAFTFTVLMVYVLLDKVRTSSMGMERRDVERVGAGLVLLCTVVVLALNPFGLMRFALSLGGSATSALTGTDGNVSTSPSLVDAVLRTPTLAINYAGGRAHENSPGCTDDDWSRLANGFTGTHCIEPKADYGTSIHFFLAGTALGMAFTLLIFALCVLYKFVKHLSFAVIGLVLLPWVAAASMLKRRSFDLLTRTFAVAAGNLIMAVVVQVFAISGPLFAALLLDSFLAGSGTSVVLSMIGLMLVYMGVTLVLLYVTRKSSALVRALRADASTAMHTFMAAPGAPGAFFGMVNNRMSQTNQTMNMLRQQLRRLRMLPSEDDTMSDRSTRTDLTPVQKVVDFGKRKYLSARVLNMGGAARNTAFTTNRVFAPSHTTSTAQSQLPGAPGSEVALRDAAGTLRGVSRDMALSATDMRAAATYSMLSEHARTTAPRQGITVSPTTVVSANVTPAVTVNPIVAIPGGGAINALSDTASDPNAVRKAIFDAQRNNPYPAFGARHLGKRRLTWVGL